jgi:hypothetical protein
METPYFCAALILRRPMPEDPRSSPRGLQSDNQRQLSARKAVQHRNRETADAMQRDRLLEGLVDLSEE